MFGLKAASILTLLAFRPSKNKLMSLYAGDVYAYTVYINIEGMHAYFYFIY